MKLKKVLLPFLLTFTMVLTGCSTQGSNEAKNNESKKTRVVKDVLGRDVEIPNKVDSIIATGAGALRMVCYMQGQDKVVGVEDIEKKVDISKPYGYVNSELSKLPVIGKGGANGNVAFEEEILKVEPDVIIGAYDEKMAQDVSQKTGIPVVAVSYKGIFDPNMDKSLEIIGDIIDKGDRAKELITYMDKLEKDLKDRTKDIKDEDKQSVYTGAVSFSGKHGFDGTYGKYPPFDAINAKNVVDETGKKGATLIDLEKVMQWNPDIIFLNPEKSSMELVNKQFKENTKLFESLDAIKKGEVYSQISYNYYTTNVELAIADAYYAGSIIYPDKFKDINIKEKADEIFNTMLGKKIYNELENKGLGFGKVKVGE
ncbi:iron ABC transporter substrate-binding protein [Romboutsia maritimum]|uniref:Iron ABC transporter substrate-binding protein n=1 Tax=Romboutsia maritimum TaxID=2020948 RepID=A0A371IRP6_9FIRM|nr:iron ABC transporter substrate-binding protein [Romboutsia maritimum]RDY23158.1 iron ABC transporter substrate-binding protein [Romboutsia maritimum]